MRPAIDLVMPVYNEEKVLPDVLASLARQVDSAGSLLPRGAFRVIAVDNGSTDRSREILENWAAQPGSPEMVVLAEPEKGVVAARMHGGNFAVGDPGRPLIVHSDSDSLFPSTFIGTISRRFETGGMDVLSYLGFEPTEFWRKVPRFARRQFFEVGSISFSSETMMELGFDERSALLTPDIYRDFENVPTQCGLAMTKEIYRRVGGYLREFNQDGTERLGEARNLAFRLDRAGARFDHVLSPPVVVNPRRYLLEAEDLWAGRSYTQGMTDLRDDIRPEHYSRLDQMSGLLDYESARRNAIQRYIVDPCIARPGRLAGSRRYFGPVFEEIQRRVEAFHETNEILSYVDVRPFSDKLVDEYYRTIVSNIRGLRARVLPLTDQ
jgi:glycosyltransferase involved in cell wall biosynthesis